MEIIYKEKKMGKFEFNPWGEVENIYYKPLSIKEPPCRHCCNWIPMPKYINTKDMMMADGVRLCWSSQMYTDFSCFRLKED